MPNGISLDTVTFFSRALYGLLVRRIFFLRYKTTTDSPGMMARISRSELYEVYSHRLVLKGLC